MADHRYLQVLPGGRSGSEPDPEGADVSDGSRTDMGRRYDDPDAVPHNGSCPDDQADAELPGQEPGSHSWPHLKLLPPLPDDDEHSRPIDGLSEDHERGGPAILDPVELLPDAEGSVGEDASAGMSQVGAPSSGRHRRVSQPGQPGPPGRPGQPRSTGQQSQPGQPGQPTQSDQPGLRVRARREIRALQAAQLLSGAGDQFARVAIAVLVYGQTGSAFLTAAAYALTYLPPLLCGSPISRLTDRLSRRTLMIGIDVARAALVASMALPGTHLIGLCVLLVAVTLLGTPFSAARSALVRDRAALVRDRAALVRDRAAAGTGSATGGTGSATGETGGAAADPGVRVFGYQAGQMLGFLAGAGLVAILQPRRTLLIDALTFLASACIVGILVRGQPRLPRTASPSPAQAAITPGADIVARSSKLRTLALLGWLAGFYVVPECLAVPYARTLGGGMATVGLLMAAMPAGAALGALAFTRLVSPPNRMKPLVELALLSCVPLIFCAFRPPLWAVLGLWALAGVGTCYQLAALTAFLRSLTVQSPPGVPGSAHAPDPQAGAMAFAQPGLADPGAGALAFAQAGLLAAQCLGFVLAGAAAQLVGAPAAVALAGLCGMATATALARSWSRTHTGRTCAGTGIRTRSGAGMGGCALTGGQRPPDTERQPGPELPPDTERQHGSCSFTPSAAGHGAGIAADYPF